MPLRVTVMSSWAISRYATGVPDEPSQVPERPGDLTVDELPAHHPVPQHIASRDRLEAVEYGRSPDGQFSDCWLPVGENAAFLLDEVDGDVVGFGVQGFSSFDVDDPAHAPFWTTRRFNVPVLGLPDATAAEVILAARPFLGGRPTLNRHLFDAACEIGRVDRRRALALWLQCLQSGDVMAHFAIGYTMYELGHFSEAYRHLRHYTEIAPAHPWNWRWYGLAAEAIGEAEEAIAAYERALELSRAPDDTDARALLDTLRAAREVGSASDG
jgi:hypothetical protein